LRAPRGELTPDTIAKAILVKRGLQMGTGCDDSVPEDPRGWHMR
jgi:hypothetical protein